MPCHLTRLAPSLPALRAIAIRRAAPVPVAPVLTACVLAAFALAACDPASLALTGASAVSAVETSKTIPDHIMSFATGDECSYRHQFAGDAWCQPAPAALAAEPARWCYASIAAMTCYATENPYETRSRRMR